jgi:hypothetical protein
LVKQTYNYIFSLQTIFLVLTNLNRVFVKYFFIRACVKAKFAHD